MTNTTAAKPTTAHLVAEFVAACRAEGFSWFVSANSVGVRTSFAPGDRKAFVDADSIAPELLALVPITRSGSMYGTDGSGVGGMVAINNGHFTLRQTGASKRFAAALAKVAR
jgi:hypothetical protein